MTLRGAQPPVRGTQSLVHMLAACWRRPELLALELLWRWGFGIPALALLGWEGARILSGLLGSPLWTAMTGLSLLDPLGGAQTVAAFSAALLPPVMQTLRWLGPLLAAGWAVASGLGRSLVLRRLDPAMHRAPLTLVWLQWLRIAALSGTCFGWYRAVVWAAHSTLEGSEPNLVAYSSWVICLSLGVFTVWALASWVFSIAPLLAVLEGHGAWRSLRRSLQLGPLTGKLVEINLALGIVKLALIVLAMVFSATPLPFLAQPGGDLPGASAQLSLHLWWAAVALLYFAASDFFQVARLALFVEFWRRYRL